MMAPRSVAIAMMAGCLMAYLPSVPAPSAYATTAQSQQAEPRRRGLRLPNVSSILPSGRSRIDGEKGPFILQVNAEELSALNNSDATKGLDAEADNIQGFAGQRLKMPQAEAALMQVLAQLDEQWPHPRVAEPRVIITARSGYAAATMPDGTIIVPLGLIMQAGSDDEIALNLGHELSHLRLGHFSDDGEYRRTRQILTTLAKSYIEVIQLKESTLTRNAQGQVQLTTKDAGRVDNEIDATSKLRTQIHELITLFGERVWARNQEDEADVLAYDLIHSNGLEGSVAAEAMFSRVAADFDLRKTVQDAAFDTLGVTVATAFQEHASTLDLRERAIERAKQVLRDRAIQGARDYFNQTHRTPQARMEGIRVYSDKAYPEAELRTARSDMLETLRASDEFKDARLIVETINAAQALQAQEDLDGAIRTMETARTNRRFGPSAVVLNTLAALNNAKGNVNEADNLYTRAHNDQDQSISAYVSHSWMLVAHGQYAKAEQIAEQGIAKAQRELDAAMARRGIEGVDTLSGSEKPFLPALIALNIQQREHEKAFVYLQKCLGYEEERLMDECTRAAFGRNLLRGSREMDPIEIARIDAQIQDIRNKASLAPTLGTLGTILRNRL